MNAYFTEINYNTKGVDSISLISGYILSRQGDKEINETLLKKYYSKYGLNFISKIKGNFVIQVKDIDGSLHLYTDQIGIKKLFYWQKGSEFIVSDNIDDIVKQVKPKLSAINLALHSLFHHFVDGRTMYEDVFFTKPASHIEITKDGHLSVSQYWSFEELLKLRKNKISYSNFSERFNEIVKGYSNLSSDNTAITLTGGMDSRTLLSSLLKNGIKPSTFTFGDSSSPDVTISKEIADEVELEHFNPVDNMPSSSWYSDLVEEIINEGDSITHLHRAHRLSAIKEMKHQLPKMKVLFTGHVGGEAIRGLSYNNYFSSDFYKLVNEREMPLEEALDKILKDYFHDVSKINKEELVSIISELNYIKNDSVNNKFYFVYELLAAIHHAQDLNLYGKYVQYVVPIFLDIDYLELLFSTQKTLVDKTNSLVNRFQNARLYCEIIKCNSSNLTYIPFSNNYSPQEYLNSPLWVLKKKFRDRRNRGTSNFVYGEWFLKFLHENEISKEIKDVFDIERAHKYIKENAIFKQEGNWHKYSNLYLHSMNIKKYEEDV